MNIVLTVLHVLVCVFLIAVVLLQRGKGAEMGAVFGGGASSTVFGSRGAGNFLTKMTTASATLFMITSLSLSYVSTDQAGDKLFEGGVAEEPAAAEESLFEELGTVAPDAEAAAGVEATEAVESVEAGLSGEAAPEDTGEAPKP
jgi:preprotein translocase subunit SecG